MAQAVLSSVAPSFLDNTVPTISQTWSEGLSDMHHRLSSYLVPLAAAGAAVAQDYVPSHLDPNAPDPQKCPGYTASDIQHSNSGLTAKLSIAGDACNAYSTDIEDLDLTVTWQDTHRLNVNIQPSTMVSQHFTYLSPF